MEAIDASSRASFALAANRPLPPKGAAGRVLTPALGDGATLEVRWIRPGAVTTPLIEWFGPVSKEIETREDVYLVGRGVRGLSLKVRGGVQLDLKLARGTRGALDVPGRVRGDIGSWQKWSFPLPSEFETHLEAPDWVSVRKVRRIRIFSFADEIPVERAPRVNEAWCAVEITDVSIGAERWWALGFEARGRSATPASIQALARLVFVDPVPQGPELREADAMSYVDWLVRTSIPSGG